MEFEVKIILIFLTMFIHSHSASSSEWSLAATGSNGNTYHIDTETLRALPSGRITMWVKMLDPTPVTGEAQKAIEMYKVDCKNFNYGVVSSIMYSADGEVIASRTVPEAQVEITPIAPDTVMAALFNSVC
jgi:hypothetical protein